MATETMCESLIPNSKPPAKTSITDKSVQAEKIVAEHTQEVPMDTEEPSFDDVVNDADQSQDDTAPKKDTSNWFKQPPTPESPDPEWSKDPNADVDL
ncbi:hypothetical protein Tco_0808647 [Tanacetum coccineum]